PTVDTAHAQLVVVSNRLPIAYQLEADGQKVASLSPGGLVAALGPALAGKGVTWVGWDGTADGSEEPLDVEGFRIEPVSLTAELIEGHYEGLSNSTLWPLFHNVGVPAQFSASWWDSYERANEAFAERVAMVSSEGAIVFVQDYHLMLVPALLRKRRPDLTIGYFHHIPFPPSDTMAALEQRALVLEGLFGADIVGFQRQRDVDAFQENAASIGVHAPGNRRVRIAAYPISIDTAGVSELAQSLKVQARASELRKGWGHPAHVFLGVDRLDYTKGIPERLQAFEELLASGAASARDTVFVQAGSPSRESVEQYQALSAEIDEIVTRVNATYPSGQERGAIVYLRENLPRDEMLALFVAADVMVVTSLADGMNLVAKEFVACRSDDSGALVLSTEAGAAEAMSEALLVNPFSRAEIVEALEASLKLGAEDAGRRMAALRQEVAANDVARWARAIVGDLEEVRAN
ncbi:trehalose-6-phosphate synthase, partial [Pontimonas sp.]|nr:trehalose-6-phosphate synthase [Pontimonas sp.]